MVVTMLHVKLLAQGLQASLTQDVVYARGNMANIFGGILAHCTVFHAKRVECAIFHLLVNISGILHTIHTYDIST